MLNNYSQILGTFLPIILMVVIFYFFLIRPQRKRDKAERDMRNSIQVGDEISTIGGFIGKVVSLKEDTLVIETAPSSSCIAGQSAVRRQLRLTRSKSRRHNVVARRIA